MYIETRVCGGVLGVPCVPGEPGVPLHSGVLSLSEHQQCSDDGAVKCGVDVFSDFVALVCSKDSPTKLHLRHQQQQQQQVSSCVYV